MQHHTHYLLLQTNNLKSMKARFLTLVCCLTLLCSMAAWGQGNATVMSKQKSSGLTEKERKSLEKQAWIHLGGMYAFGNEKMGMVSVDVGIGGDPNRLTIEGNDYEAIIDEKTGRIKAFDNEGLLVFDGYITNGGNRLEGRYKGKKIRLEGLCGA